MTALEGLPSLAQIPAGERMLHVSWFQRSRAESSAFSRTTCAGCLYEKIFFADQDWIRYAPICIVAFSILACAWLCIDRDDFFAVLCRSFNEEACGSIVDKEECP